MMRDAAFEDKGRLADSAALSHKADSPNRSASFQRPAHRIRRSGQRAFVCAGGVDGPLKEDA